VQEDVGEGTVGAHVVIVLDKARLFECIQKETEELRFPFPWRCNDILARILAIASSTMIPPAS
jgi:hypothetical protein